MPERLTEATERLRYNGPNEPRTLSAGCRSSLHERRHAFGVEVAHLTMVERHLVTPDPLWDKAASREPYFSIVTAPELLRANLSSDSRQAFFDDGREIVDYILQRIRDRLEPEFAPVSTLEYGCGVGRLAMAHARHPGSVVAVDRSEAMLAVARSEARQHGLEHIRFQSAAEFFATDVSFDLITCYSVLQRIPKSEGLHLIAALLGRLGKGGIAVFNVPYRDTATWSKRTSRRLRYRIPAINAMANRFLGKRFEDAIFLSHVYDLHEIVATIAAHPERESYLVFESQPDLDLALVFVRNTESFDAGTRLDTASDIDVPQDSSTSAYRDVGELIGMFPAEEHNRYADAYFASETDWERHLAKPFSSTEEAPRLLLDLSVLIHHLNLLPGMRVLDFGAGSGWLSRALSQLGCSVVALDVSQSALEMARATYRRLPTMGEQPDPTFLLFDGTVLDLRDQSVDRILCFHAFHHVPNQATVLSEFSRVLKPGGLVVFVEPGPRHSFSASAQFEMRQHRVIENDLDVHAIWRIAEPLGFQDLRVSVFGGAPHLLSLSEFEEFLAGGRVSTKWLSETRQFLRQVRTFSLSKEGTEFVDSRRASALSCRIQGASIRATAGVPVTTTLNITNTGSATWLSSDQRIGGVQVGAHLYDEQGTLLQRSFVRGPLREAPHPTRPGETVLWQLEIPALAAGRYRVEVDCVAERVAWFAQVAGSQKLLDLEVSE